MIPANLREFEDFIRAKVHEDTLPAIAYGISRMGQPVATGAFGFADKERGISATPETPFALASITKPMTTTGLMRLVERKLIDFDSPANDYLDTVKMEAKCGDASLATVRRLADHTAGLHTYFRFFYADEPFRRPPFDEVLDRYAKLFTAPGERYHYSNLGYGILDSIIERVAGVPFGDFMHREVFGPLGMTASSIGPQGGEALSYGPDGIPYPHYGFDHPGGSAAYASVLDLLRFGDFHLGFGPDILTQDSRTAMQRPEQLIDGERGYALGWGVNRDRLGFRVIQHTGSMGGVSTILRLIPGPDIVIAVLANGQNTAIFDTADDATAAIFPDFGERLAAERGVAREEEADHGVPADLFGRWTGFIETYEGPLSASLLLSGPHTATLSLDNGNHPIENLQMRHGRITGVCDGRIPTEDAERRPYRLHIDLRAEADGLSGAALTLNSAGGGGARESRYGNALPYWMSLGPS